MQARPTVGSSCCPRKPRFHHTQPNLPSAKVALPVGRRAGRCSQRGGAIPLFFNVAYTVCAVHLRARQTPLMLVLSSNCRRMASCFSLVTLLDFGLMAKVLLQALHRARCVPASVVPYLTTLSGFWQWGQEMLKVIMARDYRILHQKSTD